MLVVGVGGKGIHIVLIWKTIPSDCECCQHNLLRTSGAIISNIYYRCWFQVMQSRSPYATLRLVGVLSVLWFLPTHCKVLGIYQETQQRAATGKILNIRHSGLMTGILITRTCILTHWGRDKMAAIFQTTFSNGFSWTKMYEFRLTFHWSLFLGVQITIFQRWFR